MDHKQAEQLARFLAYVLGRQPDEFGLVPDAHGFLPLAEVLKVAHEEGWSHVRRNHLETLNVHLGRPVLERQAHLVRAADRARLADLRPAAERPKLLFAAIRRRAYDTAAQYGLRPQGHLGRVVLFARRDLAHRVGQRRDADPVLVTVNVAEVLACGGLLQPFGTSIFLTDAVPPAACRLPRAPRTRPPREKDSAAEPKTPKTPGSFVLEPASVSGMAAAARPRQGKTSAKDWKRERQKGRRWKQGRGRSR
jgi:putative RNA 2'-phosphotransferase